MKLVSFTGDIALYRLLTTADFGVVVPIAFLAGIIKQFTDVGLHPSVIQRKDDPSPVRFARRVHLAPGAGDACRGHRRIRRPADAHGMDRCGRRSVDDPHLRHLHLAFGFSAGAGGAARASPALWSPGGRGHRRHGVVLQRRDRVRHRRVRGLEPDHRPCRSQHRLDAGGGRRAAVGANSNLADRRAPKLPSIRRAVSGRPARLDGQGLADSAPVAAHGRRGRHGTSELGGQDRVAAAHTDAAGVQGHPTHVCPDAGRHGAGAARRRANAQVERHRDAAGIRGSDRLRAGDRDLHLQRAMAAGDSGALRAGRQRRPGADQRSC